MNAGRGAFGGETRATTERAWIFALGEKSGGGVSERVFLAGENARVSPPNLRALLDRSEPPRHTPPVSKRLPAWAAGLLLAEACGLTLFLALVRQSPAYTIVRHGLKLDKASLVPFIGLGAAVFGGLILLVLALARREAESFQGGFQARLRSGVLSTTPVLAFLFSPLLIADYWDRNDVRERLLLLGLFVLLAIVYLKISEWAGLQRKRPFAPSVLLKRFLKIPLKRRLVFMGAAAFVLYAAGTLLLVREGLTFSGDEPNYLMTTHSIVYDRDINVTNNYLHKDYFHFYSEKGDPRFKLDIYAQQGRRGPGNNYPINLPGISALMVPFYALAQTFGDSWIRTFIIRGSLIIWAVLLGLQLYLLARDLWKREGLALGLWAVYAFSAPVLFYAIHIYPEIPIALFSTYIYRLARKGGSLRTRRLLGMGLLLGSFFWFGLKYNMIFWPLLAVCVYYLWKSEPHRARILWLAVPALAGLGLFYLAVWDMFGTLSPFAIYNGAVNAKQSQAILQAFLDLPHAARFDSFFDYFLDQRDGLLPYAPFYAFAFLGMIEMIKRARRELIGLLLIGAPFVLNYAFFTHRQGYCPPGRVLAPISWIGAVAVGYFLAHDGRRIFTWLFGLAAAAGFALSGILLTHPPYLYQTTTHDNAQRAADLFIHLGNIKLFLPPFLPSFIKIEGGNSGYAPNYLWIGVIVVFIAAYGFWGSKRGAPLSRPFHFAAAAVLLGGSIVLWVLHPRPALFSTWPVSYAGGEKLGFYLRPAGSGIIAKGEGELYLHFAKPYHIIFASRDYLRRIKLKVGSEKGEHTARLTFFDKPLDVVPTAREFRLLQFEPQAAYRWHGLYVYDIDIDLRHSSDEFMLDAPYLLKITPVREKASRPGDSNLPRAKSRDEPVGGIQLRTRARISSAESTR